MYNDDDELELLGTDEIDDDSVFIMIESKKRILHLKKNYHGKIKFKIKNN